MEFAIINQIDNAFDTVTAIRSQVRSQFTYDNVTAIAFKTALIATSIARIAYAVVVFTAAFCFYLVRGTDAPSQTDTALTETFAIAETVTLAQPILTVDMDVVDLGAVAENLVILSSQELRQLCQRHGVKWRNAHGKSKHLSKPEMVAALAA
jgi:hypothetical protein